MVQPRLGGASAGGQDETTRDVFLFHYHPLSGDTVVELGAGTGSETRLLSKLVGPAGRVISVEAHPRSFRCLERAIALNRLDNVSAVHCAVTALPGPAYVEDGPDHNSNGLTTDAARGVAVPGETLATLVERFGLTRIDLLKMNIEGAELSVLRSARKVLPQVRNIVVSCHDFKADRGGEEWQRTFAGVRNLLVAEGFHLQDRPADPRPWIPYYLYATR